jgi:Transposase IS116/IS110/IS902 family
LAVVRVPDAADESEHALCGVQLIAAMTLVAELQDFLRFESPRQLMSYAGLVPGEHSSGPKRRQGSITKAGNSAPHRPDRERGAAAATWESSATLLVSNGRQRPAQSQPLDRRQPCDEHLS